MTLQNIIEIVRRKDKQEAHGDVPEFQPHPRIAWFKEKWHVPPYKFQIPKDNPKYIKREMVR